MRAVAASALRLQRKEFRRHDSRWIPIRLRFAECNDLPAPGTRRIVVLGDSNSATYFSGFGQGPPWPERMLSDFATRFPGAKLELVNSAQFGRTSADVLRTLDQDCLNRSPSIVVLMIGTNDPGYGIPLAQTTANVRAILQRVKALRTASGTPVVVVFAQPPVAQSKHVAETKHIYPAWCPYDQTEDPSNSLKPMKDRYRRLADELDVAFVPVWDRFAERGYDGSQPVKSAYLFDGLHLASEGQRLVATWIGDEIAMRME